ncbi:hypothetical protein OE88DRAFT_1667823 [Heliocybe sulcata]|uniref:Uncharacterized protein n=1 Tax=Heliocybe sulcata TaxID=5364 RepID=A0A5C3MQS6_9AGAM|nr:hypothetical protein OE88DRAFT_1667823 [Heliocybe sulcata]
MNLALVFFHIGCSIVAHRPPSGLRGTLAFAPPSFIDTVASATFGSSTPSFARVHEH